MIWDCLREAYRSKGFLVASLLGIFLFILLPAIFIAPDLILPAIITATIALLSSIIAGYLTPKRTLQNTLNINTSFLLISFLFLVFIKILLGEISFLSFSEDIMKSYLENTDHSSARGLSEILVQLLQSYVFVAILILADKKRFVSIALLLILGLLTVSTSRAVLASYAVTIIFIWFGNKVSVTKLIGLSIAGLTIFYGASVLRGDDEAIVFGNVFITAAGYPIINLAQLFSSDYQGSSMDYLIQLLIKPIPGFLFEPFGGKPIFNFNTQLTTMLTGIEIGMDRPISVFTAAAPLIYYKPFVFSVLILILTYIIIFRFGIFLAKYPTLLFNLSLTLLIMHRSNLLDFISTIILTIISIFLINFTQRFLIFPKKYSGNLSKKI